MIRTKRSSLADVPGAAVPDFELTCGKSDFRRLAAGFFGVCLHAGLQGRREHLVTLALGYPPATHELAWGLFDQAGLICRVGKTDQRGQFWLPDLPDLPAGQYRLHYVTAVRTIEDVEILEELLVDLDDSDARRLLLRADSDETLPRSLRERIDSILAPAGPKAPARRVGATRQSFPCPIPFVQRDYVLSRLAAAVKSQPREYHSPDGALKAWIKNACELEVEVQAALVPDCLLRFCIRDHEHKIVERGFMGLYIEQGMAFGSIRLEQLPGAEGFWPPEIEPITQESLTPDDLKELEDSIRRTDHPRCRSVLTATRRYLNEAAAVATPLSPPQVPAVLRLLDEKGKMRPVILKEAAADSLQERYFHSDNPRCEARLKDVGHSHAELSVEVTPDAVPDLLMRFRFYDRNDQEVAYGLVGLYIDANKAYGRTYLPGFCRLWSKGVYPPKLEPVSVAGLSAADLEELRRSLEATDHAACRAALQKAIGQIEAQQGSADGPD